MRAFQLQAGVLPAAYHLEDLGDEFDFANAARAELDVVFHAAFLHFLLDLAVQRAHGVVGVVVQIFAEHEGAHQRGDVVGMGRYDAGFAPCVAFPFAPLGDEVLLQRGFAGNQRAAVAIGAQAHIHAEHLPVGGDVAQQGDEFLPHFGEEFLVAALAFAVGVAAFGVDEDEVYVGGDVELVAACFAHGDDGQMLRRAAVPPDWCAVEGLIVGVGVIQRGVDGEVGELGDGAGYFGEG